MTAYGSSAMNTFVTQESNSRDPERNPRHEGPYSTKINAPRTRIHVLQKVRTKQLINQPGSYPFLNRSGCSGIGREYRVMRPARLVVTQHANLLTCQTFPPSQSRTQRPLTG